MSAHPTGLRRRVLADCDAGLPTKQGALKFGARCSMTLDDPVKPPVFEAVAERVLPPTLRAGDVVVMDNLSSRTGPRTPTLIQSAQAELVALPPYSPDLNPIKLALSKIKQAVRSLWLRTVAAMWSTMRSVLDRVADDGAKGIFGPCGYARHLALAGGAVFPVVLRVPVVLDGTGRERRCARRFRADRVRMLRARLFAGCGHPTNSAGLE